MRLKGPFPSRVCFLKALSLILFVLLLSCGFKLARHKPLWNDEIYSEIKSIDENSYTEILLGRNGEGNTTPLFYLTQKIIGKVLNYRIPASWQQGLANWDQRDPASEIVLRITPVVSISLSITLIFYYFSRHTSILAGLYTLFLAFSSVMLWRHWAEARPYSLWFLLTTLQSLIFLEMSQEKEKRERLFAFLAITHILLSLTVIFSLGQIAAASVLLWFMGERRWQRYIPLLLIPAMFCLFYYRNATNSHFFFDLTPDQLIRDGISKDRLYIIYVYGAYLLLYGLQLRFPRLQLYKTDKIKEALPYWVYTLMLLMAAWGIAFLFKIIEWTSTLEATAPVSSRYFVNLTPVGIIVTTLITFNLLRSFKGVIWMQMIIGSGIGYLVIHRFFKILPELKATFPDYFFFL